MPSAVRYEHPLCSCDCSSMARYCFLGPVCRPCDATALGSRRRRGQAHRCYPKRASLLAVPVVLVDRSRVVDISIPNLRRRVCLVYQTDDSVCECVRYEIRKSEVSHPRAALCLCLRFDIADTCRLCHITRTKSRSRFVLLADTVYATLHGIFRSGVIL